VDSSKQSQQDRKEAEEAARRRKLEMDVWGHLPPHVREELLNTYGERMLPKYEHLVKRFYEALSTQSDSKTKLPAEIRPKVKK
jgi:acyl-CoA reductase-like NAD-dependent aldehyde dehydrogenase